MIKKMNARTTKATKAALNAMGDDMRTAYLLHLDGHGLEAVAKEMGKTKASARTLIGLAARKVRMEKELEARAIKRRGAGRRSPEASASTEELIHLREENQSLRAFIRTLLFSEIKAEAREKR